MTAHLPAHRDGRLGDVLLVSSAEFRRAERNATAIRAIRDIHVLDYDNYSDGVAHEYCVECGVSWPCLTVTALDEAGA